MIIVTYTPENIGPTKKIKEIFLEARGKQVVPHLSELEIQLALLAQESFDEGRNFEKARKQ